MATASSASTGHPHVPSAIAENIVSSRAYSDWDQIHRDFAWLRANMPLGLAQPEGFDPFWVVTKHADIAEVGRQPLIFNNNGYRVAILSRVAERSMIEAAAATGTHQSVHSLVAMDPPEHGAHRKLTFGDFAPRGIKPLEERIRTLARESVAEMAATGGSCDFARDVALRYPMRVILELLGAPRADEDLMLKLTQEYFNPTDPDLNQSGEELRDVDTGPTAHATLATYYEYFDALTESRRRTPTPDIASTIANSVVNGALIDNWTATSYYITILTAGHDTTSSSTSGGVWALAERPELFARIKADRSLIPGLVEESIRWTTPLIHFMRTAAQDYVLRGQEIRAGDWLMLPYPSANRDEEVFDAPDEFRIDRVRNQQLSFGSGAHVCLGQHLARMEMRIFFEELFDRLESLEMTGAGRRNRSTFVGGIKSVPIAFTFN